MRKATLYKKPTISGSYRSVMYGLAYALLRKVLVETPCYEYLRCISV
jgi:hypothetical protein